MNPRSLFKRTLAAIVALLCLAAKLPAAEPVRVVCIGDSITQGRGNTAASGKKVIPTDGWRWAFWKKTVDEGVPVQFVGSLSEGFQSTPAYPRYKGEVFQNRHEARWGWTTEGTRNVLAKSAPAWNADIALIYLGTNKEKPAPLQNLTDPHGVRRTARAMRNLVKDLRKRNPAIGLVLRLPQGDGPREKGLSRAFRSIAHDFDRPGARAAVVPAPADWHWDPTKPSADTVDGCHPSKCGDEKIARGFFEAVQPWLANGSN